MSRLAGDNTREIGDASDEYGGIGRNGPLKTTEVASGRLHAPGTRLRLPGRRHQQSRRVWRVDQGPQRRRPTTPSPTPSRRRSPAREPAALYSREEAPCDPHRTIQTLAGGHHRRAARGVCLGLHRTQSARGHRHRVQVRIGRHRRDRRRAVLAVGGAARGLRRQAAEPARATATSGSGSSTRPRRATCRSGRRGAAAFCRASA